MPFIGQYEYVINPEHPRAFSNGRIYKHIIVAEEMLGRHLLAEEVVHHKDRNKSNNEPDNLIVFATTADHTRFHDLMCDEKYLILNSNGSYSCGNKEHRCIDCGVMIPARQIRCTQCNNIHKRKVERPTVDDLYQSLTESNGNFTQVGNKYGVTDNAIRKWCVTYGIPYSSKHYK